MNKNTPTPHIEALEGGFAKTVLMPGDPLRAKMIAEKFLQKAILVNGVRGALGYSGYYKEREVSIMSSGMGMPSMGIYSYELFNFYGVENIIRIGTIGGVAGGVELRDIIFGMGASTNSNFQEQYDLKGKFAPICSYKLLEKAVCAARELNKPFKIGNILTSDTFYDESKSLIAWQKMGVLGVEMETAALYMNAARANMNALAIFTVSDLPFKNQALPSSDRQNSFVEMVEIALETSLKV